MLHRKAKSEPENEALKNEYLSVKKLCRKTFRRKKLNQQRANLTACNGNASKIWNLVNKECGKTRSRAGPSKLVVEGKFLTEPVEIANAFRSNFHRIWERIATEQTNLTIPVRPAVTVEVFDPWSTTPRSRNDD